MISDGVLWARTVPLSESPRVHTLRLAASAALPRVLNYSQLFNSLPEADQARHPHPTAILSGDVVMVRNVRGAGIKYAVWLHAGLLSNHPNARMDDGGDAEIRREEFDLDSLGLSTPHLKELRDHLRAEVSDVGAWTSRLQELLRDHPQVFDSINSDPDCVIYSMIASLRFQGCDVADGETTFESDGGADSLLGEATSRHVLATTNDISRQFSSPARREPSYPMLVRRKALAQLAARPFMQCYLFGQFSERGVVPTALSMAPLDYFPISARQIRMVDLALLPPPLRTGTSYGAALENLLARHPKRDRLRDCVVDVDLDGDASAVWRDLEGACAYHFVDESDERGGDEDADSAPSIPRRMGLGFGFAQVHPAHPHPLQTTRGLFAAHAAKMRELVMAQLNGAAPAEAELDAALARVLGQEFSVRH